MAFVQIQLVFLQNIVLGMLQLYDLFQFNYLLFLSIIYVPFENWLFSHLNREKWKLGVEDSVIRNKIII